MFRHVRAVEAIAASLRRYGSKTKGLRPLGRYRALPAAHDIVRVDLATLNVSGTYTSANFNVGKDASGDVLVTYVATIGGSSADLLGRYGSAFAEPPSTPASDAFAFDAWTALGSSAGTYSGGFDFHHDGNAGGGRDVWGVGAGSDGQIGHGPGPG